MRAVKLIGLGVLMAAVVSHAQQPVTYDFDTMPPWAPPCAVPGTIGIALANDSFARDGNALSVWVGPPNILFYCGPSDSYTNFDAEIAARKSAGPAAGGTLAVVYGIVFRAQGSVFYWFAVSTAGYYGLFKFPAPGPRPMGTLSHPGVELIPWTWDFNVNQGNSPNTLRIEVRGQTAKLFINGVEKRTAFLLSDGPAFGQVALGIGTFELFPWAAVTVNFDYLTITPHP